MTRNRLLSALDDLTTADVRAVAIAMRPTTGGRRRNRTETTALTMALAIASDTGWHGRLGRTGRTLLRESLPKRLDPDTAAAERFADLWKAGAARDDIKTRLGLSGRAVDRLADCAPPRWGYRDVTRALGWSPDNLRLRQRNGTSPEPDGTDRGRDWWWPNTIEAWADTVGLVTCPDCGARVAKLPQHQRRHN